jgi:hypothetical protein
MLSVRLATTVWPGTNCTCSFSAIAREISSDREHVFDDAITVGPDLIAVDSVDELGRSLDAQRPNVSRCSTCTDLELVADFFERDRSTLNWNDELSPPP